MYQKVFKALKEEFSKEQAFRYLTDICRFHRIQCSPGIREAARYCLEAGTREGLKGEIVSYPADGQSTFWTCTLPQEWRLQEAKLHLLSPGGEEEVLYRLRDCSHGVVQRSKATPAEGLQGPVVVVDRAHELESYASLDVQGKWVLTDQRPSQVQQWAVHRYGALGILTDAMADIPGIRDSWSLPQYHQYHAFWGLGPEDTAVGFVLTPAQGRNLRMDLAQGKEVEVRGHIEADFYPGTAENVHFLIEGETEEEILLIAHLCHPQPSANDNASGASVLLEVARSLHSLIEKGVLPRPRRSIRCVWVPEMTGTYAYLSRDTEAIKRTVAALNLDMVGSKQEDGGGTLLVEKPPLSVGSFAQDLLEDILRRSFAQVKNVGGTHQYADFRWDIMPFSGGSDHYILSDPSVGIPCPMLIQWPDRYYHTCADTPDRIDEESLERIGLLAGTYAYTLAGAQGEEVAWLAHTMLTHFAAELPQAIRRYVPGSEKERNKEFLYRYSAFLAERKEKDLQSLQRLYQGPDCQEIVTRGTTIIQEILRTQRLYLDHVWAWNGQGSDLDSEKKPKKQGLEHLVPQRLYTGPLDGRALEKAVQSLPLEEQTSYRVMEKEHKKRVSISQYTVYLQYWMDSRRSLQAIVDLVEMETGERDEEFAEHYCTLLEKLGFLKMKQTAPKE